ncbi:MAG: dihydroorotate dehydrogenase-like protein [Anaerolineae bacterium]|nr:dihydroorotate dehydrogenase-like protein [Anaerolineae bacterium]
MNLNTTYLGLSLRSPLVVSSLPLSENLDNVKRMEDAGAGAVVLYSLFEEQVRVEQQILSYFRDHPSATAEQADALFPARKQFRISLDDYLTHIQKCKEAVDIPIIASLNCKSLGNWTDCAREIERAGAAALELNVYYVPTNMDRTAEQIEDMYVIIAQAVKTAVNIPVAFKLVPYFTNMAAMARRLDRAKADGLVLFNRFYQPDLDPKSLRLRSDIPLGRPEDSRLPLHWIAILYGHIKADMAATGGIYTAEDVIRMLMVGARVTMLASALLKEGIDHLRTVEADLRIWLEQNYYESVVSVQGILRQFHSKDAGAFERSEYVRVITSQGQDAESSEPTDD